jgi:PKD repeat protein
VKAGFATDRNKVEVGETINFTNQSEGSPTTWMWIFEGGEPSSSNVQNPSVSYSIPGTYSVVLTASNVDSEDTETKEGFITVSATVEADFLIKDTVVAVGKDVTFFDQSVGNPSNWNWSFEGADPRVSDEQNPTISYSVPGIYNVSLTSSNSGNEDTETKKSYIRIFELIEADFSVDTADTFAGEVIQFFDASSGSPTHWEWIFEGGNPVSSSEKNPIVKYDTPGSYNVTLTASNNDTSTTIVRNRFVTISNPIEQPDDLLLIDISDEKQRAAYIEEPFNANLQVQVSKSDSSAYSSPVRIVWSEHNEYRSGLTKIVNDTVIATVTSSYQWSYAYNPDIANSQIYAFLLNEKDDIKAQVVFNPILIQPNLFYVDGDGQFVKPGRRFAVVSLRVEDQYGRGLEGLEVVFNDWKRTPRYSPTGVTDGSGNLTISLPGPASNGGFINSIFFVDKVKRKGRELHNKIGNPRFGIYRVYFSSLARVRSGGCEGECIEHTIVGEINAGLLGFIRIESGPCGCGGNGEHGGNGTGSIPGQTIYWSTSYSLSKYTSVSVTLQAGPFGLSINEHTGRDEVRNDAKSGSWVVPDLNP